MAKIVAEFDSKDKTLVVTQDGKKLKNVTSFSVYKGYEDEHYLNVNMSEEYEEDDMKMSHTMYCSENGLTSAIKLNEQDVVNFLKNF